MKVKIIKKVDSMINDKVYDVDDVVEVVALDSLSKASYATYILGEVNSIDWIPKDHAETIQ